MELSKLKVFLIILVFFMLGATLSYGVGYSKGSYDTLKWGIGTAKNFMNIDVDTDKLAYAIEQYKYEIGRCYPAN